MGKINKYIAAKLLTAIILLSAFCVYNAEAARIKDIANIEGVAGVQVIGYGLMSGLNNTGDNQMTSFTVQSVSNMLKRFGLTMPNLNPRVRNVAAVMVTAYVPSFLHTGSKVDVQVSSIGDATSLQGGILLMTPLSTANGEIIGMAQGAISVGGYEVQALGSKVSKNITTSGRVPNGLILEKTMDSKYVMNQQINIVLREPDFTTARTIAESINRLYANSAVPLDGGTVQVKLPSTQNQIQVVEAISKIELLEVKSDPPAKIVINERTGTIVVGGNVQLLPVVVAHGGLEITISNFPIVIPPISFNPSPGSFVREADVSTKEQINPAFALEGNPTATVKDIAEALNKLNVSVRDLISIFQALKEAGALQGELIIQ